MTNSTDIQERETIARIIDPEAWGNLGWRKRMGYDTSRDTTRSLKKADAILALRSSPQPGSEGEPVAWLWAKRDGDHKQLQWEPLADLPFNRKNWNWTPLYAAAPEPLRVAEKDVRSVLLVADHALHEAYLAPVNLTVADYIDNARTRIKALLALLPTPDQPKQEVKDV